MKSRRAVSLNGSVAVAGGSSRGSRHSGGHGGLNGDRQLGVSRAALRMLRQDDSAAAGRTLAQQMQCAFASIREHLGRTVVFKGEATFYEAYCVLTGFSPRANDRGEHPRGDLFDRLQQIIDAPDATVTSLLDQLVAELQLLSSFVPEYGLVADKQTFAPTGKVVPVIDTILTPVRLADSDLGVHVATTLRRKILPLAGAWAAVREGLVKVV